MGVTLLTDICYYSMIVHYCFLYVTELLSVHGEIHYSEKKSTEFQDCKILHTDGHICGIANFSWIFLHTFQRIPWLIPFAFTDDSKCSWLKKVFQQYSEDCRVSIRQQDDIFSKTDKIKYSYCRKQIKE